MKKIGLILFVLCFVFVVAQGKGNADTVIFNDDFNSENGGVGVLDFGAFTKWNVSDGKVDLIGAGTVWNFFPGNGLYVDLDGSTYNAGVLTTKSEFNFLAGVEYKLTFMLGGNARGYSDDVVTVVYIGSTSIPYTLASSAPLASYTIPFLGDGTLGNKISFSNAGGDNVGAILDNVTLSQVPEPSVLLLLGSSLLGLVGLRRKFRK